MSWAATKGPSVFRQNSAVIQKRGITRPPEQHMHQLHHFKDGRDLAHKLVRGAVVDGQGRHAVEIQRPDGPAAVFLRGGCEEGAEHAGVVVLPAKQLGTHRLVDEVPQVVAAAVGVPRPVTGTVARLPGGPGFASETSSGPMAPSSKTDAAAVSFAHANMSASSALSDSMRIPLTPRAPR